MQLDLGHPNATGRVSRTDDVTDSISRKCSQLGGDVSPRKVQILEIPVLSRLGSTIFLRNVRKCRAEFVVANGCSNQLQRGDNENVGDPWRCSARMRSHVPQNLSRFLTIRISVTRVSPCPSSGKKTHSEPVESTKIAGNNEPKRWLNEGRFSAFSHLIRDAISQREGGGAGWCRREGG